MSAAKSSPFPWLPLLRRYVVIAMFAYWMGGFTFYGSVVIHVGAKTVSGGESEFGFVTRQVTHWLNLIGGVALLAFLWDVVAEWRGRRWMVRWGRLSLWAAMIVSHVALVLTHLPMDGMLDPESQSIRTRARFHALHKIYLGISTMQWATALLFLALTLLAWLNSQPNQTRPYPTDPASA